VDIRILDLEGYPSNTIRIKKVNDKTYSFTIIDSQQESTPLLLDISQIKDMAIGLLQMLPNVTGESLQESVDISSDVDI
jgi:hypothetical protein